MKSEDKFAYIHRTVLPFEPFIDIGCVNFQLEGRHIFVSGVKEHILQQLFENRMQTPGADILSVFIGIACSLCNRRNGAVLKGKDRLCASRGVRRRKLKIARETRIALP